MKVGVLRMISRQNVKSNNGLDQTFHDRKKCIYKSHVSRQSSFFFDKKVVRRKFMPQGITVISTFYRDILKRFLKRIAHVRPIKFIDHNLFILQDNALAHNVAINQQFLA